MLTEIQIKACQMLFDDIKTDEEIATECGVHRRTLADWKKKDEFKEYMKEIEDATREKVKTIFVKSAEKAAKRIVSAIDDKNVKPTQISASETVLDRAGLKLVDEKNIKITGEKLEDLFTE